MLRPDQVPKLNQDPADRRKEIEGYFDSCLHRGDFEIGRVRGGWLKTDLSAVLQGYRQLGWKIIETAEGWKFSVKAPPRSPKPGD